MGELNAAAWVTIITLVTASIVISAWFVLGLAIMATLITLSVAMRKW